MLSQAIIQAGGFAQFADKGKVAVHRKDASGKKVILYVDVGSILKDGKTENDIELQPDDMVIVGERLFNIFW